MDCVYFSKNFKKIIDKIDYSNLKDKVGIKVHFGEKGNKTYLNPDFAKKVHKKVKNSGKKSALVECNVLYRGSRTSAKDHLKVAKEHGFGFAPIDILDGENGQSKIDLPVKNGVVENAKIGEGIKNYNSLIVLSHFKGHSGTGFGGALKNIGMGLGSRAGKLHMHSDISPSIHTERCTNCHACVENCDVSAIKKTEKGLKIDPEKCIGCAMCIAICEYGAVSIPWSGSTNRKLQEKIVDYCRAVIDYFNRNLVYINVLKNITEDCDCVGRLMDPIMDDIGILMSTNPIAVEKESLKLANEFSNGKFKRINPVKNEHMIEYAEEKLGKVDYEVKKI